MAFLTLDGDTLPVAVGSWQEMEPMEIGSRREMDDGSQRSTARAYRGRWSGTTPPLDTADYAAARALLLTAAAATVTAAGDAMAGGSVAVVADITGSATLENGWRTITFELKESAS